MAEFPPDDMDVRWFFQNLKQIRDDHRYIYQHKRAVIIAPDGRAIPGQYSHTGQNVIYDLRAPETLPEIEEPPAAPVLTVTVNNPDATLEVTWTLLETYDALYLERSVGDNTNFVALATLAGDATEYDDTDVEVGTEYFYRIRGTVGGVMSPYSNEDSGELSAGECEYSLPDDMAAASPFFQSFINGDFSDALWTGSYTDGIPYAAAGYEKHAGNLYMSEDGKNLIVKGAAGAGPLVLQRQGDDSFTVTTLHKGGGTTVEDGCTMSRDGRIAGTIDGDGAVWMSGPGTAPTMHTDLKRISYISPDGLRLYAINNSNEAIERTIGGADVVIHDADAATEFAAMDHCGECVVVDGSAAVRVYRKVAGVWTHTATLADNTGDTGFFPACAGMSGDGTKAIGGVNGGTKCFLWDLTGTGTLTATLLPLPADAAGTSAAPTAISTDGSIAVGWYTFTTTGPDNGCYWLASEGFATAHNLGGHLNSNGFNIGLTDNQYCTINTAVVSADGTHIAARADKAMPAAPDQRSIYYAACPAPT